MIPLVPLVSNWMERLDEALSPAFEAQGRLLEV
jgi:hypothetical protein